MICCSVLPKILIAEKQRDRTSRPPWLYSHSLLSVAIRDHNLVMTKTWSLTCGLDARE